MRKHNQEWLSFCEVWLKRKTDNYHPQQVWWKWVSVMTGETVEKIKSENGSAFFTQIGDLRPGTWAWDNVGGDVRGGSSKYIIFKVMDKDGVVHTYRTDEPL